MSAAPPRTAAQQAARRWSWWTLWLWLAVPFLLVLAAVVALPMTFEETPTDRADAVTTLRPPVAVLLAAAVLAAAAGWRAARRTRRAPRRGGAETAGHPPELGEPSWTDDGTRLVLPNGPVTRPGLAEQ